MSDFFARWGQVIFFAFVAILGISIVVNIIISWRDGDYYEVFGRIVLLFFLFVFIFVMRSRQ